MAITPKNFMEFFEKEFGTKFVDNATGKRALDVIAKDEARKICGFCKWGSRGEGKFVVDIVCVNGNSEYVTEYVNEGDKCVRWEKCK